MWRDTPQTSWCPRTRPVITGNSEVTVAPHCCTSLQQQRHSRTSVGACMYDTVANMLASAVGGRCGTISYAFTTRNMVSVLASTVANCGLPTRGWPKVYTGCTSRPNTLDCARAQHPHGMGERDILQEHATHWHRLTRSKAARVARAAPKECPVTTTLSTAKPDSASTICWRSDRYTNLKPECTKQPGQLALVPNTSCVDRCSRSYDFPVSGVEGCAALARLVWPSAPT